MQNSSFQLLSLSNSPDTDSCKLKPSRLIYTNAPGVPIGIGVKRTHTLSPDHLIGIGVLVLQGFNFTNCGSASRLVSGWGALSLADFSPGLEGRVGDQFGYPVGVQVKAPHSRIHICPSKGPLIVTSTKNKQQKQKSDDVRGTCFRLQWGVTVPAVPYGISTCVVKLDSAQEEYAKLTFT